MEEFDGKSPIVTYDMLIKEFPKITQKSKNKAKEILPLYPSPELAMLVATLMTDGHVDWYINDGRPRTRRITLYSSDKNECDWFVDLVDKIFNVRGRTQTYIPNHSNWKKQPYKAHVFCAVVARILILAGAPAGNKTEKEFLVPYWIMEGNIDIRRAFLKTFFSFEGSVPYRKKDRPHTFQMGLVMNKSKILLRNGVDFFCQLRELLNEFGVSCSKIETRPTSSYLSKGGYSIYFSITNQKSIIYFYQNIGFLNDTKQAKLESCFKEIHMYHRLRFNCIGRLFDQAKYIIGTDKQIAEKINKFTNTKYTNRQMEHFRRNETSVPLEVIFALIKIKKDRTILNELPDYVAKIY
jgi:hypothetical protein